MPAERLEDVVEYIANLLMIYGADERSSWTSALEARIRRAMKVEKALEDAGL